MIQSSFEILPFILWNLLLLVVVGILYFFIKEFFRIRGGKISKIGIFIIGSSVGVLLLLVNIFLSSSIYVAGNDISDFQIYNGIILSPTILITIAFVINIDRRMIFSLFSFQFISLIIFLPIGKSEINSSIILSYSMFIIIEYIILFIYLFLSPKINFIKNNGIKQFAVVSIYLLISFVIYSFFILSVSDSHSWISISNYLLLFVYFSIYVLLFTFGQYIFISIVDKAYLLFSFQETFSTKDDISYYKMSLAKNSLIEMIGTEKIEFGLIVLFDIKAKNDNLKSKALEKIKKYTENKFTRTFFFKVSANYYGAFYEVDHSFNLSKALENNQKRNRDSSDYLSKITNEIKRIEEEDEVKIISTSSIYGIHSYSVTELIENCRFLMNPNIFKANLNPLVVYDFKRVKERLNETSNVRSLPIDIENMNISFARAISADNIFYPRISFNSNEVSIINIVEKEFISLDQIEILFRFISYQALRKFNKEGKLILYYPLEYIQSEKFDVKDFLKKVSKNIKKKNLIVGVDTFIETSKSLYLDNISVLRKNGIEIAIINPQTLTQEKHDEVMPDYIIDVETSINPLKTLDIKLKIKTDAILLNSNLII